MPNMTAAMTQSQCKNLFDDPYVPAHFTRTPASKSSGVQKPAPQRDPGEEMIVDRRVAIELWYLGVERKIPEFEVEDTKASLRWETFGKTDKLIVTTETEKGSETFKIDINDLELWAVSPNSAHL